MKSRKVELWARIGQVSFWIMFFSYLAFTLMAIPDDASPKYFGSAPFVVASISIVFAILFSEAIVRIIIYFAQLLERR